MIEIDHINFFLMVQSGRMIPRKGREPLIYNSIFVDFFSGNSSSNGCKRLFFTTVARRTTLLAIPVTTSTYMGIVVHQLLPACCTTILPTRISTTAIPIWLNSPLLGEVMHLRRHWMISLRRSHEIESKLVGCRIPFPMCLRSTLKMPHVCYELSLNRG